MTAATRPDLFRPTSRSRWNGRISPIQSAPSSGHSSQSHRRRRESGVESLPIFLRLGGEPVILIGDGHAAEPRRRLLERAGALPVGEENEAARLAFIVIDDDGEAEAAATRLRARGL